FLTKNSRKRHFLYEKAGSEPLRGSPYHFKILLGFMCGARHKRAILVAGGILATYFGLYFLNAVFGGYDPHYTSDGRNQYGSGLLMHDCIMWQPRFGYYYNEYRFNLIGLLCYPLLQLDQRFVHRTHSVGDGDFPKWLASVTDSDIHPVYRKDW